MGCTETIVCDECDGDYELYAVHCDSCETSFCRSCGHDCEQELERCAPCGCNDGDKRCGYISSIEERLINLYNEAMDSGDWSEFNQDKAKADKHWRRWAEWNKKLIEVRGEAA